MRLAHLASICMPGAAQFFLDNCSTVTVQCSVYVLKGMLLHGASWWCRCDSTKGHCLTSVVNEAGDIYDEQQKLERQRVHIATGPVKTCTSDRQHARGTLSPHALPLTLPHA